MSTTSTLTSCVDDAESAPLSPSPTAVPAPSSGDPEEDGSEETPSSGGSEEDVIEGINWVEMPREILLWIMVARKIDPIPTLEDFGMYTQEDIDRKDADGLFRKVIAKVQAVQDEFFEFQNWVREVYILNGRVMIPK